MLGYAADTRGLMTATIDLQPAAGTPDRRLLLLDQLDERLASMPQVAAALASHAPLEAPSSGGYVSTRIPPARPPTRSHASRSSMSDRDTST